MDIQFPLRGQNNQKEVMLGVHQRETETAQVGINGKQNNIASMVSNSTNLSTVLGQTSENPTSESYSLFLVNKGKEEGRQDLASDTKSQDQLTTMYVYTDIVKSQIVGDVQCPLLGVVPVKPKERDVCFFAFSHPYYIRLERHEISEINIKLKTDTGDPFPLAPHGKVVSRLHFRRKHLL